MRKNLSIILVILVCMAAISFICVKSFTRNNAFDDSINLAIAYIANHTEPEGRFIYKTSTDPEKKFNRARYNSVRHAGVLYSMYLCERYLKNHSLRDKRYLASDYFVKRYIKPAGKDMFMVISLPEEENKKAVDAKTGASGLALAALSNLYGENKVDLKILQGLGNFLVYMQKSDGSFYSKYDLQTASRDDKFKSLYYPGEAALGLLYLNEAAPSEKWVDTSKKALLYLTKSREKENMPFDHWYALALKKLFETPDNHLTADEELLLRNHASRLAGSAVLGQIMDKKNKFYGSFGGQMRLNSIATVMEGLNALYYCVDDRNLKKRIKQSLYAGNAFIAKYQVKEGDLAGGIPYSPFWAAKQAPSKYKVIRIDNVQHALSAWILYSIIR